MNTFTNCSIKVMSVIASNFFYIELRKLKKLGLIKRDALSKEFERKLLKQLNLLTLLLE